MESLGDFSGLLGRRGLFPVVNITEDLGITFIHFLKLVLYERLKKQNKRQLRSQEVKHPHENRRSYCWSELHLDVLWYHAALLTSDTGRQDPDGVPSLPVDPRPEEMVVLVEDEAERDVCRHLATIDIFCRHDRQKTRALFEQRKMYFSLSLNPNRSRQMCSHSEPGSD